MMLRGDHGSAWRRRHRRLRSWWRHEQQSVALALSAAAHHSFDKVAASAEYDGLRAQKTDRAGEAAHKAPRRQKSKAAGGAVFFELFDEDTVEVRPGVLAEPRPQVRVQRHTMEHIVDFVCCAPMVQFLDAPVPQMGDQLPDILHFFSTFMPDPEQVIGVPKILRGRPHANFGSRSAAGGTVGGSADEPGVRACGGCLEGLFEAGHSRNSLRTGFNSVLGPSRSLTFLLEEFFQVFAQERVPHRVHCSTTQMREFKGFFSHISPNEKKCGGV